VLTLRKSTAAEKDFLAKSQLQMLRPTPNSPARTKKHSKPYEKDRRVKRKSWRQGNDELPTMPTKDGANISEAFRIFNILVLVLHRMWERDNYLQDLTQG
jgi:hypothetical protein